MKTRYYFRCMECGGEKLRHRSDNRTQKCVMFSDSGRCGGEMKPFEEKSQPPKFEKEDA